MTDNNMQQTYAVGAYPSLPPPPGTTGTVRWIRENLCSSPLNVAITILCGYLLFIIIPPLLDWAIFDAVINANHRNECRELGGGACWALIRIRFDQLIYGFYPEPLRWRVNLAFILLFVALAPVLFDNLPGRKYLLWFSLVYPVLAFFLLWGGGLEPLNPIPPPAWERIAELWGGMGSESIESNSSPVWEWIATLWGGMGLEPVESAKFGGFMLTVLIGATGIILSLPIGILLALGRQSDLVFIKAVCICFIEFMRGVPLITLLFIASTLLNYFLPPGSDFDLLLRVLIMVTLFAAAYIAEVIRGGLAAIPNGQSEAADAMGLTYWKSMRLVILPQALKISIPGIVNTFIGLYKDTTLVLIIGLLDPLGLSQAILADSKWQGLSTELYVFIAVGFFISCFAMSRYSLYLERKLHTGH